MGARVFSERLKCLFVCIVLTFAAIVHYMQCQLSAFQVCSLLLQARKWSHGGEGWLPLGQPLGGPLQPSLELPVGLSHQRRGLHRHTAGEVSLQVRHKGT